MRLLVVLVLGVIACADDQAPVVEPEPDPACFDGDERVCDGSNIGACRSGVELCIGGAWQACIGAVGPTTEVCNEVDDDCDGAIDHAGCVLVCPEGYADCNGEREDGCEGDLGTSATCGACDRACNDGLVCELGECRALPAILWTGNTGLNAPCGLSLADNGDTYVAGYVREPLTLGGRSTEPYGEYHFDIYAAVVARDGTARWLIRDGDGPGGEQPHGAVLVPETGGMLVTGSVSNATTIANQSLPQFTEQRGYLASYDSSGAGRWVAVTPSQGTFSRPFVGPDGIDVAHRDGTTLRLSRFDLDGEVIATASIEATTTSWLYPVGQSSGSAILFANVTGEISDDCTVTAGADRQGALVTITPSGQCTATTILRTTGSVGFSHAPLRGGMLIAGTVHDGSLTAGSVTLASSTALPYFLVFDAAGDVVFHRTAPEPTGQGKLTLGAAADDRGNLYWFRGVAPREARLDSFRPDGVARWSVPFLNTSLVFPGVEMVANGSGQLAIAIPADGDLIIGSTTIPGLYFHFVLALLQVY